MAAFVAVRISLHHSFLSGISHLSYTENYSRTVAALKLFPAALYCDILTSSLAYFNQDMGKITIAQMYKTNHDHPSNGWFAQGL